MCFRIYLCVPQFSPAFYCLMKLFWKKLFKLTLGQMGGLGLPKSSQFGHNELQLLHTAPGPQNGTLSGWAFAGQIRRKHKIID